MTTTLCLWTLVVSPFSGYPETSLTCFPFRNVTHTLSTHRFPPTTFQLMNRSHHPPSQNHPNAATNRSRLCASRSAPPSAHERRPHRPLPSLERPRSPAHPCRQLSATARSACQHLPARAPRLRDARTQRQPPMVTGQMDLPPPRPPMAHLCLPPILRRRAAAERLINPIPNLLPTNSLLRKTSLLSEPWTSSLLRNNNNRSPVLLA
jgi:hypothetical protein